MRRLFPPAVLVGILLALAPSANAGTLFVLKGRGWGHAIGMSQWGAQGMALRGVAYPEILGHYYQGTSLGLPPSGTSNRRVLLDSGRSSLTLSSDAPFKVGSRTLPAHTNFRLVPTADGKVRVVGVGKVGNPALFKRTTAWLELDGGPYRGDLQVRVVQGRLAAVNIVGLNRYLYSVVPGEMPAGPTGFANEALKAQAVAARSYAVRSHLASWYDLYDDTRSQVYEGVDGETARATAAVDGTGNSVVLFGGAVAQTYYSSSSGGRTSTPKDAWGAAATNLAYLKSVADPDDLVGSNPHRSWRELRTAAQLKGRLGLSRLPNDGTVILNSSQRVGGLSLSGRGWTQAVTPDGGDAFRSILGIDSNRFSLGVLRLTVADTRIEYRSGGTKVSAFVRALQGAVLERRPFGGAWQDMRAVDDAAQIDVFPAVTTWFRLGTPSIAGVTVRVAVEPKLRIETARAGSLAGTMRPKIPGTIVSVQRFTSGWKTVKQATVNAQGSWKAFLAVRHGATYRVQAAPGHGYVRGTSPEIVAG
jgi:stage II sporulation protein D